LEGDKWYPIRIEHFKGEGGDSYLHFSWKMPGKSEFEVVSPEYLRTKSLK